MVVILALDMSHSLVIYVIKFIPYIKFQLLYRHLRPFDHIKIDKTEPLAKVFQGANEWSEHIQAVSL
jgi:hypothetical protein